MFIVGHVNKDGAIAGPKVMEHIVDTVLYFEGDKMLPYRILRAAKNRYGSTNELGMFDMTGQGLAEIENPSQMLLEAVLLAFPATVWPVPWRQPSYFERNSGPCNQNQFQHRAVPAAATTTTA